MSKKVLVLNILDEDISSFIIKLQEIFNQKPFDSLPHVTIRGPYNDDVKLSKNVQEKLNYFINNSSLEISDIGMFDNNQMYFVYFKVFAKGMEKISRKKDFPKSKYGFNPHITIYKGSNKEFATTIYEFLKEQDIRMNCKNIGFDWCSINKKYPFLPLQHLPSINIKKFEKYITKAKEFIEFNYPKTTLELKGKY